MTPRIEHNLSPQTSPRPDHLTSRAPPAPLVVTTLLAESSRAPPNRSHSGPSASTELFTFGPMAFPSMMASYTALMTPEMLRFWKAFARAVPP